MIKQLPILLACATTSLFGQGPAVTSWIVNPGSDTGYNGILSNVLEVNYTSTDAYVSCTCVPGYDIGPWAGNPNTPANQDFTFKITRTPQQNTGAPVNAGLGHIGVWRNGVSIFNAKDGMSYNNQGIWNRDALVFEGSSFDACLGHPAPNGEYHHHVSPNCLYVHTNDEVHSDLIGFAFDGFPVYGAFGSANADGTGAIARMRSSYRLRDITERTTLPNGTVLATGQYGPAIGGQYPLGAFIEDYEFVNGFGDLDAHNGRTCVTPDYPDGIYAYFVTLDEQLEPAYPYTIGPTYFGTVQPGNTGPQSGHNTIPGNAVLFDPNTGITDAFDRALMMYPVPSDGELTIRADGSALSTVEVFDAQGRTVAFHRVAGTMAVVEARALLAGVYSARITSVDGDITTRTFVRR
ncbi:MAG: YHYH protein [Flavobacteriales bacterium]|nr:YHYH protein [Flavobacteriales bacterium]